MSSPSGFNQVAECEADASCSGAPPMASLTGAQSDSTSAASGIGGVQLKLYEAAKKKGKGTKLKCQVRGAAPFAAAHTHTPTRCPRRCTRYC